MGYKPRNHEQQIVGWWLGVPYSKLTGNQPEVEGEFESLKRVFGQAAEADHLMDLVPERAFPEEKKRQLARIKKVMGGLSVLKIAEEEQVCQATVVASVRYMLARLAIVADREAYE